MRRIIASFRILQEGRPFQSLLYFKRDRFSILENVKVEM